MKNRTSKFRSFAVMVIAAMLFAFAAAILAACDTQCMHTDMENHPAVAATCTQGGNDEYWTCPACEKIFADAEGKEELAAVPATEATGHVWETAYTNDANGHWHKCKNCDATSASEPHTVTAIGEEKAPTCTEDGSTAGEKCSVCGYVFEAQETLGKLGHKLTHYTEREATCTETSIKQEYWHCERCGDYYKDVEATQPMSDTEIAALTGPALGHQYDAITIAEQPSKRTYFVGDDFDAAGMKVTAACTRSGCGTTTELTDYTLSGDTELAKGERAVTVTWNDGTQDLTATVTVDVYQKHDLTQQGSYADFVYEASGDLTAAAAGQLSGTAADVVHGGNTYTDGMSIASGTSLTLTEEAVQGILGDKTYGDFAVTLLTDTHDQYEMNIAVVTKKIASAQDLTDITDANKDTELVDGYYIVTADFDAADAGIQMSRTADGHNWSAKAVSFASVDSVSFDDTNKYHDVGFKGIFDGRGHTISNLNTFAYMYRGTGGLFGQLLDGSVVKNVAFKDVTVNGRYGAVLVGETCAFDGLLENVAITVKETNITNSTDKAKILWALTGGNIKNCLFVGVDTVGFGTGDTDAENVMYVAENGAFDNSGTTKYDGLDMYRTVNAMFADLDSGDVTLDFGDITYSEGAIAFNEKTILLPVIVVSYECENNEIARGSSLTFTTDGYALLTLEEGNDDVSVKGDTVTVKESVEAGTTFTVVCTSTLNSAVKQEFTFTVIRAYQDETIAQALDFSLEGESSSVQVSVEGNIERIVAGSVEVEEGYTLSEGTLTLQESALQSLLNGRPYAEGLTVNIYTTADKKYTATVNIATMFIDGADDLTAITQANTAATIDAYYIVTQSFDASAAGVVRFVNNDTQANDEVGFNGIFDGRGHIISNLTTAATVYNGLGGLFGMLQKGSAVKNVAFTNVSMNSKYKYVLSGESRPFYGTIENVVITAADGITLDRVVARLSGGTMKNCLFVGFDTINTDTGTTTISNIMSVTVDTSCGGFSWTGNATYDAQPNYADVNAMFAALETENKLQNWGDITYSEGAIFFNGEMVLGGESA